MQRPTFTATAVIDARRNPDKNNIEFNLIDAKGNTQNLVLDNAAVGHVLAAILQKSQGDGGVPEIHLNESIPLYSLSSFNMADYAGLRMYINPTSVIDFSFANSDFPAIKAAVDRFVAKGPSAPPGAPTTPGAPL